MDPSQEPLNPPFGDTWLELREEIDRVAQDEAAWLRVHADEPTNAVLPGVRGIRLRDE